MTTAHILSFFLTEWFREARQTIAGADAPSLACYDNGGDSIFSTALRTSQLNISEAEQSRIKQRSLFNSKEPGQMFVHVREELPEILESLRLAFRDLNAMNPTK